MKLQSFISDSNLLKQSELDKTALLAFYNSEVNGISDFNISDVLGWFRELNLSIPNSTRLKKNIEKSKEIIRGTQPKTFRLHANTIIKLETLYPNVSKKDEEVECEDIILPEKLYINTRGYIESLSKQINASYENNILMGVLF